MILNLHYFMLSSADPFYDLLIDFEYIKNSDGTVTLTEWKGTYQGVPSTEIVIPDSNRIIL